jgi:hypothetical protein
LAQAMRTQGAEAPQPVCARRARRLPSR